MSDDGRGFVGVPARAGSGMGQARPVSAGRVVTAVAGHRGYQAVFAGLAAVVTLAYTVLLPFAYTQRVSFANWAYLNPYFGGFAAALGLAIAGVVTLQVVAVRQALAARRAAGGAALGGVGLLASLAPSLLCCTPVIPAVVATLGASTLTMYTLVPRLQYIFAAYQAHFLAASLVLLALIGYWSARRIAAGCAPGSGCAWPGQPDPEPSLTDRGVG